MKIAGVRLIHSHVGMFIGLVYAYGAFLGVVGLVFSWLWDRGIPQLQWWQFLLAPFAIGLAAAALEGLGTFCASGFTFGQTESKARLIVGKVAIIVLLLVLLLGIPMYKISHQ